MADFGISKTTGSISRYLSGTPCYFAPEVVEDELYSVASDIYALGVTLVHLANGKAPFIAA